jgi:hypothetical protein
MPKGAATVIRGCAADNRSGGYHGAGTDIYPQSIDVPWTVVFTSQLPGQGETGESAGYSVLRGVREQCARIFDLAILNFLPR